jgi:hypothetical protein
MQQHERATCSFIPDLQAGASACSLIAIMVAPAGPTTTMLFIYAMMEAVPSALAFLLTGLTQKRDFRMMRNPHLALACVQEKLEEMVLQSIYLNLLDRGTYARYCCMYLDPARDRWLLDD